MCMSQSVCDCAIEYVYVLMIIEHYLSSECVKCWVKSGQQYGVHKTHIKNSSLSRLLLAKLSTKSAPSNPDRTAQPGWERGRWTQPGLVVAHNAVCDRLLALLDCGRRVPIEAADSAETSDWAETSPETSAETSGRSTNSLVDLVPGRSDYSVCAIRRFITSKRCSLHWDISHQPFWRIPCPWCPHAHAVQFGLSVRRWLADAVPPLQMDPKALRRSRAVPQRKWHRSPRTLNHVVPRKWLLLPHPMLWHVVMWANITARPLQTRVTCWHPPALLGWVTQHLPALSPLSHG